MVIVIRVDVEDFTLNRNDDSDVCLYLSGVGIARVAMVQLSSDVVDMVLRDFMVVRENLHYKSVQVGSKDLLVILDYEVNVYLVIVNY